MNCPRDRVADLKWPNYGELKPLSVKPAVSRILRRPTSGTKEEVIKRNQRSVRSVVLSVPLPNLNAIPHLQKSGERPSPRRSPHLHSHARLQLQRALAQDGPASAAASGQRAKDRAALATSTSTPAVAAPAKTADAAANAVVLVHNRRCRREDRRLQGSEGGFDEWGGDAMRKHSLVSISMHFHLVTYGSLRHEFKITHAPSAVTTTYSRGRATRTTLTRRRRSTTATTQS